MLSTEIRAEIEIDATPDKVWAVLTDVEAWGSWNPVLLGLRLRGPLQVGTKGKVVFSLAGRAVAPTIELLVVDEDRELTWKGGVPFVFVGRHGFRLIPTATGTRVVHTEVFSGVLTLGLRLARSRMNAMYTEVNEGLRRRCEGDA